MREQEHLLASLREELRRLRIHPDELHLTVVKTRPDDDAYVRWKGTQYLIRIADLEKAFYDSGTKEEFFKIAEPLLRINPLDRSVRRAASLSLPSAGLDVDVVFGQGG